MARVTGVGGIFLRSNDPEFLKAWYVQELGLPLDDQGYVVLHWDQGRTPERPGSTVWAAFPDATEYFGSHHGFMVNFRVDELEPLLDALRARGIEVSPDIDDIEGIGRFGWCTDPEGRRVELWEPAPGT